MKNLKLKLLAFQIEYRWMLIGRERRKGKRLLKAGYSHSSKKLLKLNRRFSKNCAAVMKAQHEYEQKSGINSAARKMQA